MKAFFTATALFVVLVVVLIGVHVAYLRHPIVWPSDRSSGHQRSLAPESIQPWMTFEYLNFVFKLPPDYLRQTLSLESPTYPKITLKRAAQGAGMETGVFVQRVEEAIRNYKP